jgi:hypothetical protein
MTSKLYALDLPADRMEGEVAAAFFFEDERPLRGPAALLDWRLDGVLTDLLVKGLAAGRSGEHILVTNNGKLGSSAALFCGAGSRQGLGAETYFSLIRHLLETCRRAGFFRFALCLNPPQEIEPSELKQRIAEMLTEGDPVDRECLLSLT